MTKLMSLCVLLALSLGECMAAKPLGYWSVRGSYVRYESIGTVSNDLSQAISKANGGDTQKAQNLFANIIRSHPNELMAIKGYVDCAIIDQKLESCAKEIKQLQNGKSNQLAKDYADCVAYFSLLENPPQQHRTQYDKEISKRSVQLQRLVASYPDSAPVVALYGSIGYNATPSSAIKVLEGYLSKHESKFEIRMLLVFNLLRPDPVTASQKPSAPQYQKALSQLDKVFKADPDYAVTNYYRGAIYASMKNQAEARRWLQKFIDAGGGFDWQQQNAKDYVKNPDFHIFEQ